MFSKIFHAMYYFLISLKLAVVLIIAIMGVLAAGTIIESLYGAVAAKILVYNAPWFGLLLSLLGLNVFAVALSRWPWKKRHTGFVLTHLGILILLAGALVSRYYMIDGQIAVSEGNAESFITIPQSLVMIQSPNKGQIWAYNIPQKPFAWEGREPFGEGRGPFSLAMLNYYPKAQAIEQYQAAFEGLAALKIRMHNGVIDEERWLVQGDPQRNSLEIGPMRLLIAEALREEKVSTELRRNPVLAFSVNDKIIEFPLEESLKLPMTFTVEGTPYKATLWQVFRHGVVSGGKLIDHAETTGSDAWVNPALKLRLEGVGVEEEHTVFAKFPDFPTLHGQAPHPSGVQVRFNVPGVEESQAADREIRFVSDGGGELRIQQMRAGVLETVEAATGDHVSTDWMGLTLDIEEFLPHAQQELVIRPLPDLVDPEGATTAVRLAVAHGEKESNIWLEQGKVQTINFGGEAYTVAFSLKRIPLGFKLKLQQFTRTDYPGTHNPATFSSDVVLTDAMRGVTREVHISMNEPLDYRGFKIYQSGYFQEPGQPDVSIFAVSYDPGIWLTYLGSCVMILGILVMIIKRKQVRS